MIGKMDNDLRNICQMFELNDNDYSQLFRICNEHGIPRVSAGTHRVVEKAKNYLPDQLKDIVNLEELYDGQNIYSKCVYEDP